MSQSHRPPITAAEVAEQVAAILGAAERDAMAILEHARHEPSPVLASDEHLEQLTAAVAAIDARVRALEDAGNATPAVAAGAREDGADEARLNAARMRVVDLALGGGTRQSIAEEIASIVGPIDAERLLDEALDPS